MTQEQKKLPNWILIVSSLFALLVLFVTASLIFSPQSLLKMVDLNAKGVDYVVYMWASRQFAGVFICGYATFKKSASMLTLAFIFFLVMNIGEFFIGISQHYSSIYIGAGVMCIIDSAMIYFINRQSK